MRSLAVLATLFGAVALLVASVKRGRRILMIAGLGCIAGAAWFGGKLPSHGYEMAITMVGSALMACEKQLFRYKWL